jgi:hypothetical protein
MQDASFPGFRFILAKFGLRPLSPCHINDGMTGCNVSLQSCKIHQIVDNAAKAKRTSLHFRGTGGNHGHGSSLFWGKH